MAIVVAVGSSLLVLSSTLLHHDKSMETLAIGKLFSILDEEQSS